MRQCIKHFCAFILIVVVSCGEKPKASTAPPTRPAVEQVALNAGDLDEQGRLVIFPGGSSRAVLETEYALIFQTGIGDTPLKPQYDFASRDTGFESFADLGQLEARLRQIPPPRIVDFYYTCGAQPWSNLSDEDIDAFFEKMQELGIELRSERPDGKSNFICTCPAPGE